MKTRNTTDWIRRVLAQESRLAQRLKYAVQDLRHWAAESRQGMTDSTAIEVGIVAQLEGQSLAYDNAAGLIERLLEQEAEIEEE